MNNHLPDLIAEGTEDSIATARELLRAAEKRGMAVDFGSESDEPSGVDWRRLQKSVSRPTMTERLLGVIEHVDDRTLALSGMIPILAFPGAVVFLYELAWRSVTMAVLAVGITYVVFAVSSLWAVAAYKANARITKETFPPMSMFAMKGNGFRLAALIPILLVVAAAVVAIPRSYATKHRKVDAAVGEASVALQQHRFDDALLTYEEASRLLEDDPALYLTIGKNLHSAAMNLNHDDPKQRREQVRLATASISYLQRAVALQKDAADPEIRIAELQYALGKNSEALQTVARAEAYPNISPGDLEGAGLVLAAITQDEIAKAHVDQMTPEQRAAFDENLKQRTKHLQDIRDRTHSYEIASAVVTIYLTRANISTQPAERQELTALALRETTAMSAQRGAL